MSEKMSAPHELREPNKKEELLKIILSENTRKRLLSFIKSYIKGTSAEDADDILQKTLIKATKSVQKDMFIEGSNLQSWLYKIAQNSSISLLRRRKTLFDTGSTDSLEEKFGKNKFEPSYPGLSGQDRAMLKKDLEHYLDQLSPEHREIMVLVAEGYGNQEIAARLGVPVMTVGTRIFRARKFLEALVKNEEENI